MGGPIGKAPPWPKRARQPPAACFRPKKDRLPDAVLTELAAIGMTRATDVLSIENGQVTLKPSAQMDEAHAAAIASVEKTSGGFKIKFYDKLKALELLGSHLGMFGGSGRKEEEENNLLEAILSSTREAMDISDIQELQQTADPGDDLVE